MRIVHVSAEVHPFAMTGGLASVASSLPSALHGAGHDTFVITPLHSQEGVDLEWLDGPFRTPDGMEFGLGKSVIPGSDCPVVFVASNEYFNRRGLYGPTGSEAWPDNAARFSFFCRAALEAVSRLGGCDVLHCHDWHAGLVPVMSRLQGGPPAVFTIHNLAFQGTFPLDQFAATGLPTAMAGLDGLEYHGGFSFMKGGILFSERVTTVSPTYASEVTTPEGGFGMEGLLLQKRGEGRLEGILNGIDNELWGPEDDPSISPWFTPDSLRRRSACRSALLEECGLTLPDSAIVAGVVSRLTWQKGLDLVLPALEGLIAEGRLSLAVLGTGESWIEDPLSAASRRFPGRVFFRREYDDPLSRRIYAGCDIFLMPSRFEPCGLSQMIAMRYGAIPVVRRTGGLADTVTDIREGGCGIVFDGSEPEALRQAVGRAAEAYGDVRSWRAMQRSAMRIDNSWTARVPAYLEIYRKASGGGMD
ncbi:MAG TPA: glycogen synthase [Candidatus Fermentibacter daniensis]|nr:MAG: Glycogen synthase [candidate division Hyd24-12 bacterium ADurb.Bin004]HOF66976.1 glycogen synthase [Candidatus Fermentibacter daniensis]HOR07349.1 glycogen synthase [Candidatus Fermentibacter daniensis]HOZ16757.1 glycogen synthase [Candidatus Fermentibacter daniensis]HPH38829.1 glycogen synthase [Candidatus Fermentibacter daniensis]